MFKKIGQRVIKAPKEVVNYREIKGGFNYTKSIVQDLNKFRKGSTRVETFEEAVERRRLTEDDLRVFHRQHIILAHIFLFFMALAVLMGVYHFTVANYAGVLTSAAATIVMVAVYIPRSFRAFQIERRELCAFNVWAKSPKNWLPSIDYNPNGLGKGGRHD